MSGRVANPACFGAELCSRMRINSGLNLTQAQLKEGRDGLMRKPCWSVLANMTGSRSGRRVRHLITVSGKPGMPVPSSMEGGEKWMLRLNTPASCKTDGGYPS